MMVMRKSVSVIIYEYVANRKNYCSLFTEALTFQIGVSSKFIFKTCDEHEYKNMQFVIHGAEIPF